MKFFMSLRSIYLSVIEEMAKEEHLEILFNVPTTVTMLKKEKAKTFDVVWARNIYSLELNWVFRVFRIPASFQVRPLQTEDAFDINSVWPQKGDGTEEFVSYMIENNTNVGLYNESDELIAWCLKHDFGSLASLQVDEHHLKKGYGETVTKAICKKVAIECDVDITASIVHDNYKSKNLFKKLGFENIDTNFWIGVKKKLKWKQKMKFSFIKRRSNCIPVTLKPLLIKPKLLKPSLNNKSFSNLFLNIFRRFKISIWKWFSKIL